LAARRAIFTRSVGVRLKAFKIQTETLLAGRSIEGFRMKDKKDKIARLLKGEELGDEQQDKELNQEVIKSPAKPAGRFKGRWNAGFSKRSSPAHLIRGGGKALSEGLSGPLTLARSRPSGAAVTSRPLASTSVRMAWFRVAAMAMIPQADPADAPANQRDPSECSHAAGCRWRHEFVANDYAILAGMSQRGTLVAENRRNKPQKTARTWRPNSRNAAVPVTFTRPLGDTSGTPVSALAVKSLKLLALDISVRALQRHGL
jgi:hypothetical protein